MFFFLHFGFSINHFNTSSIFFAFALYFYFSFSFWMYLFLFGLYYFFIYIRCCLLWNLVVSMVFLTPFYLFIFYIPFYFSCVWPNFIIIFFFVPFFFSFETPIYTTPSSNVWITRLCSVITTFFSHITNHLHSPTQTIQTKIVFVSCTNTECNMQTWPILLSLFCFTLTFWEALFSIHAMMRLLRRWIRRKASPIGVLPIEMQWNTLWGFSSLSSLTETHTLAVFGTLWG